MSTAICVIVRNEERGLLEWIAYHRVIGFDQILVYDNQSTDGTAEMCRKLAAAGVITYRFWPDPAPDYHIGPQVPAYEHAAAQCDADWLCFLDADEFLVLEHAASVAEWLAVAGRAGMPIALNWKIFGSSGEVEAGAGLVTDRFLRCGPQGLDVNRHIKTIGPTAALRAGARVHVHGWVLEGAAGLQYVDAMGEPVTVESCTFVTPPRWRGAWVNHYIVKSRQEFEEKRLRGKATHAVHAPDKYDRTYEGYFLQYDRNEEEDRAIQRFRAPLMAELAAPGFQPQRRLDPQA
jgi:glycosyltransferase involved in cell wall biosynthesis